MKLQQAVRESRLGISREYAGLLSDLDIQKRFAESVRRHPLGWMGGAAVTGLLATFLGGRRRSTSATKPDRHPSLPSGASSVSSGLSKAGWLAGALEIGKLLYPVLRPVAVELIGRAAQAGLAKKQR